MNNNLLLLLQKPYQLFFDTNIMTNLSVKIIKIANDSGLF